MEGADSYKYFHSTVKQTKFEAGREKYLIDCHADGIHRTDVWVSMFKGARLNPKMIDCVYHNGVVSVDEYFTYRNIFKIGKEYAFTISSCEINQKHKYYILKLRDVYGNFQTIKTMTAFEPGEMVICTIVGFNKCKGHVTSLQLTNPRKRGSQAMKSASIDKIQQSDNSTRNTAINNRKIESQWTNKKSPEQWYYELKDYDKHIYRDSFRCSCCGEVYGSSQGYKIELKDIFLCLKCKRMIFERSGNGYINIVYTNMGHKR